MARSITEIRDSILAGIAADGNLATLNNASATAIYKLIAYVVAVAINVAENIAEQMRDKTVALLGTQRLHGSQYYIDMIKGFQFSDTEVEAIILDDYYIPRFEVPNDEHKIVTSVAIREGNRKIFVKVNKGEAGALLPLTVTELKSLKNYCHLLKDLGTQMEVESLPAETLRVKMQIDHNLAYGNLIEANVQTLINGYLLQMGYANRFSVQEFEAALLADKRIVDLKIETLTAFSANGTQNAEIFDLARGINTKTYLTVAGHMNLDNTNSQFILNATV